jgi:UDP-N-acetylglucosamine 1-carboxyvinyltransferase
MVLQAISKGTCIFTENLFEMRYKHIPELIKMGARIKVKDRVAVVDGTDKLYGAEVDCHDLRGGAALAIAGLVAEGYTTLNNIRHIDRGYYKLEESLSSLGADIKRI